MAIFRLKPKNDFVFNCLFGESASKDALIALLNAILRPDGTRLIVDLTVIENKQLRKTMIREKTGRLDIRAELDTGEQINVEMQIANHRNMAMRTLFYLSKLFISSIKEGDSYHKLKKTITINLLDFELFPFQRFHSTFHFIENEEHVKLTDALEVHFIEFPKFERMKHDLSIPLHRWLLFMDEKLLESQLQELITMHPQIEKAERLLELLSADAEVRRLAEALQDARRERISLIEDGVVQGRIQGLAEGKAEGKAAGKQEVALNLLAKGMDVAFVAEVSGLTTEQVQRLAASAERDTDRT